MRRFRTWYTVVGPLLVIALLLVLDPDSGFGIKVFSPGTTVLLLKILSGLLLVSCAFWTTKILFDYPEADTRMLFKQVRESHYESGKIAAAVALLARVVMFGIVLYAFASSAHAGQDVRSYIPAQAKTYAPMLKSEQMRFWAGHPQPYLLAGLVEQETCLSLTHSRCWNPASRLKSAREEGAGLGQLTRAYRKDGSERFDALAELRSAHPELAGLTWENIYQSPEMQLRAIVLKILDIFKSLRMVDADADRLAFSDAAYNGGLGGVQNERRACGLKVGCDPQRWFGHVEQVCLKSKAALYGRNACTINREHVMMVMKVRSAKYAGLMS
jgi:hypothetical protein